VSGSVNGMTFANQKKRANAAILGGVSSNVIEEDGPEGAAIFGLCTELIDIEGPASSWRSYYPNPSTHDVSISMRVTSGAHNGRVFKTVYKHSTGRWSGLTRTG